MPYRWSGTVFRIPARQAALIPAVCQEDPGGTGRLEPRAGHAAGVKHKMNHFRLRHHSPLSRQRHDWTPAVIFPAHYINT